MKIAILAPVSLQDFRSMFSQELPEGLQFSALTPIIFELLKDNEVVIVTLDKKIKKPIIIKNNNLIIFVGIYRKYGKLRALDSFNFEIKQMVNFLKKCPCDIYHAHWTYEFAMAAQKININKTLITVHDWAPNIYNLIHDFYRKKRLTMSDKVLSKAYYVSCVSPYILDMLKRAYPRIEAYMNPNCIQTFHKYNKRKYNNGVKTVICVNNGFGEIKNVKCAILSFLRYHHNHPNSLLKMFGSGYEKNGVCNKWVIKNNLNDPSIVFCGSLEHDLIIEEMCNADVLLHTAREESFGLVLAEAMMVGTPVVGGSCSGAVPWILNNGEAGVMVNINSVASVCSGLESVLDDEYTWTKFSNAGYNYAFEHFSLKKVTDTYLEIYKKIVGK